MTQQLEIGLWLLKSQPLMECFDIAVCMVFDGCLIEPSHTSKKLKDI